jgi:hypothetical protein
MEILLQRGRYPLARGAPTVLAFESEKSPAAQKDDA